jgi:hypothetical protein
MKQSRLLEIIREEISGALTEAGLGDQIAALDRQIEQITKQMAPLQKKKADLESKKAALSKKEADLSAKTQSQLEEETLNEKPDFGGQLDQGVAAKYGEEDTLQTAVDEIVGETLADMSVTLEDIKKDEVKATEALNSIREKVLGAKRKGIPQDPRVVKALEKQQDIEVDKLGAISGKDLQANQTNNAIKKALGIVTPDQRGRKADPNKPEKAPSTGKRGRPAASTSAGKEVTLTPGDDGFDDVSYNEPTKSSDEEKAAAAAAKADKAIGGKYAASLTPEEEDLFKTYKRQAITLANKIEDAESPAEKQRLMGQLKSLRNDPEVARLFKAKGVNV